MWLFKQYFIPNVIQHYLIALTLLTYAYVSLIMVNLGKIFNYYLTTYIPFIS